MASKLELCELMKRMKQFGKIELLNLSSCENVRLSIEVKRTARKTCI